VCLDLGKPKGFFITKAQTHAPFLVQQRFRFLVQKRFVRAAAAFEFCQKSVSIVWSNSRRDLGNARRTFGHEVEIVGQGILGVGV